MHEQEISFTPLISDLLHEESCVVIPDLGAFLVTEKPAKLDINNGKLIPAHQFISFNTKLNHQDGLLAIALQQQSGKAFEECARIVAEEVRKFKSKQQNILEINDVGKLVKAKDSITFFPSPHLRVLASDYGLQETLLLPLNKVNATLSEFSEQAKSTKNRTRTLITLSGAAAACIALIWGSVSLSTQYNQALVKMGWLPAPAYKPEQVFEITYTPLSASEANTELSSATRFSFYWNEASTEPNSGVYIVPESETTNEGTPSTNDKKHSFDVIVGAFANMNKATKLCSKLRENGLHKANTLPNGSGLTLVSAGGYDSENEAFDVLHQVAVNYPDAWVKANN